jgi:hypothetical protein
LNIGETEIFLQAAKTSTRNVGPVEDIEDEDAKQGSDKMKIDFPNH